MREKMRNASPPCSSLGVWAGHPSPPFIPWVGLTLMVTADSRPVEVRAACFFPRQVLDSMGGWGGQRHAKNPLLEKNQFLKSIKKFIISKKNRRYFRLSEHQHMFVWSYIFAVVSCTPFREGSIPSFDICLRPCFTCSQGATGGPNMSFRTILNSV